ncbi:MAG TPA: N-acetylmuramic acid 6-phosphate etherase [Telluria sp.]|nr:N-acetylmuramic acid 6-phosphate etherase [Telluria sp.]
MLRTETPNAEHRLLDRYATADIAGALIADQQGAALAVLAVQADIARAVDAALPRIAAGGRLIYVGAGTSGRLGVLDSAELHPTFSWPRERAIGILAGGKGAVFDAVEGAEDSFTDGVADLERSSVAANDVVLLLAASGGTPYVMGALQAARQVGALTVGFANNPHAPLTAAAEIGITLDTGPEVISGSTRLKAGTAQKIALNTFSSTLMVCLNKVYGNLMVDVRATNVKLVARTVALTRHATGASEAVVQQALEACGHSVKVAIVMIKRGIDSAAALALLDAHGGSVRAALGEVA